MRMKKLLILLFVFGMFFIGCDLVYVNMDETFFEEENSSGGINKTLVEDDWTYGNFSKDGQIDTYYISVVKGTRYFIFTLNRGAYTGLKISYSNGTVICGNYGDATNLFEKPYEFTATSTGTVTVTVASWGSGAWEQGTGQYAIKYSSRQEDDVLLSEGVWKDDRIIAKGQTNKHHINVTAGMRYFIWLNASDLSVDKYDGDGTKTADAGLKISYSDGTVICNDYTRWRLYKEPYTFTAPSTGTIIVTVASYGYAEGSDYGSWEVGSGTYAIKYTSRPEYDVLSEGVWKDDNIIADGQTNVYSISVTSGKRYYIYVNNKDGGDETKTAKTGLKISYSDGTIIYDSYDGTTYRYPTPYSFVASSTGTVMIAVAAYDHLFLDGLTGTYAIKCTSQIIEDCLLSEGQWKDDEIIADGQTNRYSIYVTKGRQYSIYINGKGDGDGTKTAYAGLKISHSDGTTICSNYNGPYWLYSKPYTFTASSTGTITIIVASYSYYYYLWERGTGTYAIKYTSRPEYYELSEGEWKDDEITTDGQINKYSFYVISGTKYTICINNANNGDGTKTAYTGLKISHSDGTAICSSYDNFTQLWRTFTALSTGTVMISVACYDYSWEKGTGTYAIKYTEGN